MATTNKMRALNRLPYDFQDGLKIGGVDVSELNQLGTSAGASIVGYMPAGTGAVPRDVQSKLRETVSVTDNGADKTGASDSFAAFNASPDNSFVPAGTYNLSASVIGKTFFSFGDVTLTGAGSANIVNVVDDFNGAHVAIDQSAYPGTTYKYKFSPSLAATTSGKVIAVYRVGPGHQGGVGESGYLVYRVYNKLTGTWGPMVDLVKREGWDSRNQIIGVTSTGRIIVAFYQCQYSAPNKINDATRTTKYKYSDDDGLTWSSELNLSQYCPYPSLDNVPFGKFIEFNNGNLLITLYNYHTIFTLKSTDNGSTWGTTSASLPNPNANITTVYTSPVVSDDNITEPTLVKINDLQLVCIGRCIPTGLVADGSVILKYMGRRWKANTRYEVGMWINTIGDRMYECTVAGTTSSTYPTHTGGTTAIDGTVTWREKGAYADWSANTSYSLGQYVVTYSEYLYRVQVEGTSSLSAPSYSKLEGDEPQFAWFKTYNGGATWGAANYVTWTTDTYRITTSPPTAIVRGDTVDIAWFSRSPEWTLYRVRMSAGAFFQNPSWAFAVKDGEKRSRVMRSLIAPAVNAYALRIETGYVEMTHLPWSHKILAAWYDCPTLDYTNTSIYSTIIE